MRHALLGQFDGQVYRREPRRLAVILSSLFLLSLSAVATLTTVGARNGAQDAARMPIVAISPNTAH